MTFYDLLYHDTWQVRMLMKEEEPFTPLPAQLGELLSPCAYEVRVYVLEALNLTPQDRGSTSDPYIIIRLGNQVVGDRNKHLMRVTSPEFRESFVLGAELPGSSMLRIEV